MEISETFTAPKERASARVLVVESMVGALLIAIFIAMFLYTFEWSQEAALFPRLISILGAVTTAAYIGQQVWMHWRGSAPQRGRVLDIAWTQVNADTSYVRKTALGSVGAMVAFWVGIVLVGFQIAAPIYLFSQLVIYGRLSARRAVICAIVILGVIVLVYDQLAGTTWNDPVLWELVKRWID